MMLRFLLLEPQLPTLWWGVHLLPFAALFAPLFKGKVVNESILEWKTGMCSGRGDTARRGHEVFIEEMSCDIR